MQEVICELLIINQDGEIRSKSNFDLKYFNNQKEIASKIMEGLHYDFLHRMKEESLIEYKQKQDA